MKLELPTPTAARTVARPPLRTHSCARTNTTASQRGHSCHRPLLRAERGEINESLQLFQAATCLNPHNLANLKQVGRSLYLLARHKAALDVYEEALRIGVEDWEIWYAVGPASCIRRSTEAFGRLAITAIGRFPCLAAFHVLTSATTCTLLRPSYGVGTTRGCATCT